MQEIKDMVNVTRCGFCRYWKNLDIRPNGAVKSEDLGFCSVYRTAKEATGYCDRAKESKE